MWPPSPPPQERKKQPKAALHDSARSIRPPPFPGHPLPGGFSGPKPPFRRFDRRFPLLEPPCTRSCSYIQPPEPPCTRSCSSILAPEPRYTQSCSCISVTEGRWQQKEAPHPAPLPKACRIRQGSRWPGRGRPLSSAHRPIPSTPPDAAGSNTRCPSGERPGEGPKRACDAATATFRPKRPCATRAPE
jgi:hypothetical protein